MNNWEIKLREKLEKEFTDNTYLVPKDNSLVPVDRKGKIDYEVELQKPVFNIKFEDFKLNLGEGWEAQFRKDIEKAFWFGSSSNKNICDFLSDEPKFQKIDPTQYYWNLPNENEGGFTTNNHLSSQWMETPRTYTMYTGGEGMREFHNALRSEANKYLNNER